MKNNTKKIKNLLSFPWPHYFVAFLDYLWVITIYVTSAFLIVVFIDGYLLPPFNLNISEKQSTTLLAIKVLIQIAFQGFIAILLFVILNKLPTPVKGLFQYNPHTSLGVLLRNPALITILLFSLSKSLQGRLAVLYSRFNKNALTSLKMYKE